MNPETNNQIFFNREEAIKIMRTHRQNEFLMSHTTDSINQLSSELEDLNAMMCTENPLELDERNEFNNVSDMFERASHLEIIIERLKIKFADLSFKELKQLILEDESNVVAAGACVIK